MGHTTPKSQNRFCFCEVTKSVLCTKDKKLPLCNTLFYKVLQRGGKIGMLNLFYCLGLGCIIMAFNLVIFKVELPPLYYLNRTCKFKLKYHLSFSLYTINLRPPILFISDVGVSNLVFDTRYSSKRFLS